MSTSEAMPAEPQRRREDGIGERVGSAANVISEEQACWIMTLMIK